MASPSYSTDLTTSLVGDLGTETWDESSNASYDDAGAMVDDINLYYINTSCVSAQFTKDGTGTIIGDTGASITVPTDGAILVHHLWAAPPALSTYALGGVFIWVGDSMGDAKIYYVSGSDRSPAPEGGWATYAVDPAQTHQETAGTAPTTWRYIGGGVKATAQARGNPHAVNAVRYGRCEQIYTVGDATTPAVFSGYAAIDSASTARYNLLQPISGGYKFRGLMSLGQSGTAVYFDDANTVITISDDTRVSANFNKIEVNNAGSTVLWTAVSISALGTTSKGRFEMVDNATVTKTACTFTDMDYFTYQSNATLNSTTYRRCGIVTLGGGTFNNCLFTNATGTTATIATSLSPLVGCTFESSGTGYAVDLSATTISSNTTMSWTNTSSGYTDTSGNRTLKVTVDGTALLTINNDTGDTIYYENAGTSTAGANGDGVVIVTGQRTITFNISPTPTDYEYRIYTVTALGSLVGASEVQGTESASASSQAYTYSYAANIYIAIQILDHTDVYRESINYYELADASTTQNITLEEDTND